MLASSREWTFSQSSTDNEPTAAANLGGEDFDIVSSTTSSRNSSARTRKVWIFWLAWKLCTDYYFIDLSSQVLISFVTLLASVPSAPFFLLKLPLRSTLFSQLLYLSHLCSFRRACQDLFVALLTLSRRPSRTPRLTSPTSMKSSWSVVQPISPVLSNSFPTSSTAA